MSRIKTAIEIKELQRSGQIIANVLQLVAQATRVGITTFELNELAERLIKKAGGRPSFKGFGEPDPFPAALCTSVNDQIVHGIPNSKPLQDGDIVGLDIGMVMNGLYTDTAVSVPVGSISPIAQKLLRVTEESLRLAIDQCWPDKTLGDIGYAIQSYVEKKGFAVVRDLVGHGVGHAVHEWPSVPNFGQPNRGEKLKPGMVLAIEPMVVTGSYEIDYEDDGWTIRTADHGLAAHFEHTIAITDRGPIVITKHV
ncbi:MAG: type I methionyl aminopeptidase [Candidatus Komeilibacteria bacterium CG_4_10_14_0_2_um_filter_37_10]|uniref:Methionine aminopeptidase n=1 Tax=Candidatus Komeilibacteria bacterium CG_4_10_14_0_2_um_filter_37_10 TaxID=1974470 RepID=A0A2M7VFX3_9BACT|nr:MAG: type I methionyl aminopeptidase [Candidatus Komeilibacteria bacterium CG_4_10_14_0_2_um_filter_37_10]